MTDVTESQETPDSHPERAAEPAGGSGLRRSRRGSVYVITIVTLTVAMVLGLALMRASGNGITSAERFKTKMQLKHIADAGAEYGYWYYATRRPMLPATISNTLGDGDFEVTIDGFAAVTGTIKVRSEAHLKGQELETTYLLPRPAALPGTYSVFEYAICSDQSSITDRPIRSGTGLNNNNHVNVNGHLMWTNSASKVWGNAFAAWNISSPYPQVKGTTVTSAPMLPFPDVDWNYYYWNCAWYYSGDKEFKDGITFPYDGAIVWVGDDLKFKGPISGRGIIVACGDIEFTDQTWYATGSSKVAFIAGDKVTLKPGKSMVGFVYAHDDTFSAYIEVPGTTTVTSGCLVADRIDMKATGDLTVVHDSSITEDPNLGAILHLPGY